MRSFLRTVAPRRAFALSLACASLAAATAVAQNPPPTAPPAPPPTRPVGPGGPAGAPTRPVVPGDRGAPARPGADGQPSRRANGTPVEERPEGLRPRRVPAKSAFTGGPAIWFDVLDHDFGPMTNAETRKAKFTYFNIGDAPLTLKDIVPACGCTQPRFDRNKTLKPGESAVVEVDFTPPTGGHQAKALHIVSDAANVPEVFNIRVIGEVESVLSFEPKTYDLGERRLGQPVEEILEVKADAEGTYFDSVASRSEHVVAAFVDEGPRKGTAKIKVTIAPTAPWGFFRSGVLQLVTKGKLENGQEVIKQLPLRLTGTFVDGVRASDYVIQCGNMAYGAPFTGETTVTSVDGQPFELTNAKIEPMSSTNKGVADFQSSLKVVPLPASEGIGYKLLVNGVAGQKTGFISGNVTFDTKTADGKTAARSIGINGRVDEPGAKPPSAVPPSRTPSRPASGGTQPAGSPPVAPPVTNPGGGAPPAGR